MSDVELTILVPVYNEKENIEHLVSGLKAALDNIPYKTEVLLIDDGSKDGSSQMLDEAAKREGFIRVVHHEKNRGFGAAIITGYANARGKYISTMDADLTHDPLQFLPMIKKVEAGHDIVVGSRYVKGGGMKGVAMHRKLISDIGRLVIRTMFGLPISDVTNGFRTVKKDVVNSLGLKETSFNVLPEMIVKAQKRGYKVGEEPMTLTSRKYGVSKMKYKDYYLEIKTLLKLKVGEN